VEFLRQLLVGVGQAWQRLSASARINLIVAGLATATIIVALVFMGSRPHYVRLYSQLDLDDAAAIQSYLSDQANVPFKVENDGQTILVPADERSRLRVALMEQNLPRKQGVAPGFELFEEQDLMTTRWLQDVKYMRAIQGELQRQLNEFDFINKSFVFIREAREELFVSEQKPSEAAVTLEVKRPLSKGEVKALLGVISSFGGANLHPGNITLTTTDGTALHVPPESEFASIANSKLEYIAEIEKQREDRALRDLEKLGVRALVKVSALVDFTSKKVAESRAAEGTPISEFESTTTTTSGESIPEGAPGVMANLPTATAQAGRVQTSEETEEVITNYQPTVTDTETVTQPGEVRQYIVSAIIEGDYETTTDEEGKEVRQYVSLTDERKKAYENHLRAAVGEGQTPTEIVVSDHPFKIDDLTATQVAVDEVKAQRTREIALGYIEDAVKLALIVAGFIVARRFLRRAMIVRSVPEEQAVRDMPKASPEDLRRQDVAAQIERVATEQPDAVAALLRSWMAEDR